MQYILKPQILTLLKQAFQQFLLYISSLFQPPVKKPFISIRKVLNQKGHKLFVQIRSIKNYLHCYIPDFDLRKEEEHIFLRPEKKEKRKAPLS